MSLLKMEWVAINWTQVDSTCKSTKDSPPPVFYTTTAAFFLRKTLQLDDLRQRTLDSSWRSCELDLLPHC